MKPHAEGDGAVNGSSRAAARAEGAASPAHAAHGRGPTAADRAGEAPLAADIAAWVQRAREGGRDAFEQLYRSHVGRIYALCIRMVGDRARAEQLTQDAFVRAWQKLGSYRFECHSGDITLTLPESVDADFDISTFNGEIQNAFGPRTERTSRYTSGYELDFSRGGGAADVRAETFSGDLELRIR
ncbi:MAG: hypothetical protein GF330_03960 [Candidatus Eisenbacteria bacterium]|nr:hypothetical protein [Candidatus Eisenbacteria bacterium]